MEFLIFLFDSLRKYERHTLLTIELMQIIPAATATDMIIFIISPPVKSFIFPNAIVCRYSRSLRTELFCVYKNVKYSDVFLIIYVVAYSLIIYDRISRRTALSFRNLRFRPTALYSPFFLLPSAKRLRRVRLRK